MQLQMNWKRNSKEQMKTVSNIYLLFKTNILLDKEVSSFKNGDYLGVKILCKWKQPPAAVLQGKRAQCCLGYSLHNTRAPVATCRQSPYLWPVPSATKPAILIMKSFSLWRHSLLSWPCPVLRMCGHLTAFNYEDFVGSEYTPNHWRTYTNKTMTKIFT